MLNKIIFIVIVIVIVSSAHDSTVINTVCRTVDPVGVCHPGRITAKAQDCAL